MSLPTQGAWIEIIFEEETEVLENEVAPYTGSVD